MAENLFLEIDKAGTCHQLQLSISLISHPPKEDDAPMTQWRQHRGQGAVAPSPTILVRGWRPSKEFVDVIVYTYVDLATHVVYTLRVDAADTAVQSYVDL